MGGNSDFSLYLLCYVTEMEHRSVKKAGIEVQEIKGWSDSSYACETQGGLCLIHLWFLIVLKIFQVKI